MDCTPYPHYLDFLMPFILLFGSGFGVGMAMLLARWLLGR